MKKRCNKCGKIQDKSEFYKESRVKSGLRANCKKCERKYSKVLYQKYKKERKKYRQEHREEKKIYDVEYRISNRKIITARKKRYYKNNKKEILAKQRKYLKSKKGKKVHEKAVKKYTHSEKGKKQLRKSRVKRRGLGNNELFINGFPEMEIEWHHINDNDMVALPKTLHRRFNGYSTKKHRELLLPYVEMFYGVIKNDN